MIGIGQTIKYWMLRVIARKHQYEAVFCNVRHAMVVVEGGRDATVSQMEPRGGEIVSLTDYAYLKYAVVHTKNATTEQRDVSVAQAKWCVGIKYGFVTILGMVINIFIPFVTVSLALGASMVCSTAASLTQRALGFIPDEADDAMFPADLARLYDVRL
jgi:hypothetical protein